MCLRARTNKSNGHNTHTHTHMQSYTYAYSTYSWHIQTFISSYRHAVISNSNELSPQLVCGTRSHSGQKTKSQNIVCLLARARWRWRWSQRFWPSASASNPVSHLPVMGSVRESLYLYRRFPSRATHTHTCRTPLPPSSPSPLPSPSPPPPLSSGRRCAGAQIPHVNWFRCSELALDSMHHTRRRREHSSRLGMGN